MLQIDIAGESLTLLAERALWWPAQSTLLIADAHFGKGLTFRARGVAVPSGTSDDTMDRLAALLARTGADRVVFLGDLLHAREARQPALMSALAALRAPGDEWVLVRGNHDLHAGVPAELGLTVVDEPWLMTPFALCHHPDAQPGHYVLAGHVHPALRVEAGGDRLRLPCFAFGPDVGLLPAFGSFTGHMTLAPDAGMRCFVAAADRVLEVPHASARWRGRA
jgi:DNA ligase-associated metallophosphoesterase